MAYALDMDYSDIEELGVDSDELTENFLKAAKHLQSLTSQLDNNTLLLFYGYYKQALEGSCNVPKPKWYDTKGKSKWEAWNKLGNMSPSEAKTLYVEEILKVDPNFTYTASVDSWVKISTMQSNDQIIKESDKLLIDYVKEGNCKQVVDILKSHNEMEISSIINKVDENGLGLIHWAADRGSLDILKTIVSYGADVNLIDSDKQTALHYAASCGHSDCVTFLLNSRASVNSEDSDGLTPKQVACDDSIKNLFENFK